MRLPLKQLGQDGATQGQVVTWNDTTGKYEPGDSNLAGGLSVSNRDMVASVTTADGQLATSTTLASTITAWVEVQVNGAGVEMGDGVKTKACYMSGDSGTTARAYGALVTGDQLFWNGSIAGYELSATDRIDVIYDNEGAGGSSSMPDANLTTRGVLNNSAVAAQVATTNIDAGGATNGDTLVWNSTTSHWEAAAISAAATSPIQSFDAGTAMVDTQFTVEASTWFAILKVFADTYSDISITDSVPMINIFGALRPVVAKVLVDVNGSGHTVTFNDDNGTTILTGLRLKTPTLVCSEGDSFEVWLGNDGLWHQV